MLINGVAEIISIGSLIPFLAALTNSESLLRNDSLKRNLSICWNFESKSIDFWMTILFCLY